MTTWAAGVEGEFWLSCTAAGVAAATLGAAGAVAEVSAESAEAMAAVSSRVALCLSCRKPAVHTEARYDVDTGVVHASSPDNCYERYREAEAEVCAVCASPILGGFYDLGDKGKVGDGPGHDTCYSSFQEQSAEICAGCNSHWRDCHFDDTPC